MRTALEMADFILEKMMLAMDTLFKFNIKESELGAEYKMQLRLSLINAFRPIEQVLEEDEDVLYVIPAASVGSTQRPLEERNDLGASVVVVFTANRCIFVHTDSADKKTLQTIPYDELIEIRARPAPKKLLNDSLGELIVSTTTDILRFRTKYCLTSSLKHGRIYAHFVPEWACETVTALVMKYKQAKCAAQQGEAAPQQTPQPQEAPQPAPQQPQAVPQAAPQPVPQAAAPAGAGLPPETIETLKQLKGLLDADILTQEEFDAKKKQLLGL